MNKIFGMLLSLIFGLSAFSFAATDSEEVIVITKKKQASEIYEDSSEANRLNKKGIFSLGITGAGPNLAPGQNLTAGMYIDRNKMLLLELKNGVQSLSRYSEYTNGVYQDYKSEAKIKQLGVHYKQFTGNSFYFRTGLDYNQVDFTFDYSQSKYYKNEKPEFSGESLIANFTIGNQWQWETFTLGCDWIGIASPIYYKLKSQNSPSDASIYDSSDFETDKKLLLKETSGIALRFYMGASF